MEDMYSFKACQGKVLKCIFDGRCQLIEGGNRCLIVVKFVGLLSINSHGLKSLQRQFNCPFTSQLISLYACLGKQQRGLEGCKNCQSPLAMITQTQDLRSVVQTNLAEVAEIKKEVRKRFTVISDVDRFDNSPLGEYD